MVEKRVGRCARDKPLNHVRSRGHRHCRDHHVPVPVAAVAGAATAVAVAVVMLLLLLLASVLMPERKGERE